MPFREAVRPGHSHVVSAGWIRDKPNPCMDRDLNAYAVVYLIAGGGTYRDETGRRETLVAGDVFTLFPGLVHSYWPRVPGDWTECWITCSGPVFAALESDGILDRDRPVTHPGIDDDLTAGFDAIVRALDRAHGGSDRLLVAKVHQFLVEMADRVEVQAQGGIVARARAALESDLTAPIDLPALAARLGVGYDTLRRAFLAEVGTTPGRWRQLRRMERAKTLLVDGRTLDTIASELGFCDQFYFARQFKQVVGCPPGQWRNDVMRGPAKPRT